ncbi:MAG: TolB family protein [Acidobacteriota bacterium]
MRGKLALALVLGACGPGHNGHDPSTATLTIDPPTSELLIMNGVAATEDFTATLVFKDGSKQDVTADTTFAVDPEFGVFNGTTLSINTAGKTQVFGMYTDKMGSADVLARLKDVRVDTGVDPNAPSWFSGPEDPSRAPTIVYPAANVIMPRNLGDFEVHWIDGSTNDVFEVSLTTAFADVRAYVKGGNGAGGGPDPSWMAFLASEWTAAVGTEINAQVQVRGVQSSNPTSVGSAPPQNVNLSNEPMQGGLYYWASSSSDPNEPYGIYRHDMSKPGQPAQQFYTTAQTSGRCVACHVLSRDGAQMLVTYDGGDRAATRVDVATAAATPVGGSNAACTSTAQCAAGEGCMIPQGAASGNCQTAWNFAAFTADSSQVLTVHDGVLVVRSYPSLSVLTTMPGGGYVTHPDLSPDGTRLVYVRPQVTGADWAFGTGNIYMRTYDQTSMSFGPEQQLVADGANNYYPTFSPDGQWILFDKGDNTQGTGINGSYNGPNATLWAIKADNTAPAVPLTTANMAAGLTDSWGRWAPFAETYGGNKEPMFWVTVSSKRDFGVRLVGTQRPQIWMTPFFPDKAAAGQDPSAVAFRLPFQDIVTNNHIAQWTTQVVVQ